MAKTLKQFLSELATDPKKLGAFIADSTKSLDKAGLSDSDKELIKSGNLSAINQRLLETGESGSPPTVVVVSKPDALRLAYGDAISRSTAVPAANPSLQVTPNIVVTPQIQPNVVVTPQIQPNVVVTPQVYPNVMVTPQVYPNVMVTPQVYPPITTPLVTLR